MDPAGDCVIVYNGAVSPQEGWQASDITRKLIIQDSKIVCIPNCVPGKEFETP